MSVLKPKDGKVQPTDFESAEPGRQGQRRNYSKPSQHSNPKRTPQKIRNPPTKRKDYGSRYKKLYEKVRELEYSSFEEWLASLTGPEAPQIRRYARAYRTEHPMPLRITLPAVALITAYILSRMTGAVADNGVMVEFCEERGQLFQEGTGCVQPAAPSTVPNVPAVIQPRKKPSGSEKRRVKRDKRKERLKQSLVELSETRATRLPVSGLGLWTQGKWLQYMVGTLADDDQYFENEMNTVKDILAEVYALVDGLEDGASDGQVKRDYMKPVLQPVIYDLAVNTLRTDWAFVNATFHKNIYDDAVSSKMQRQRAMKIVARLAKETDVDITTSGVATQLIRHVDNNPESWYNQKVPALKGTNMVKFLRAATKGYVRKALQRIPEDNQQSMEEALHVAAVMDASLSGKAIQKRVSETASVGELQSALSNANPTSRQIVEKYQRCLKDVKKQRTGTEARDNAINKLLASTLEDTKTNKLVRDVRLLWSIYDEESENAFSEREREKYSGIAERFLNDILRPYRERDAQHRGHREGTEFLNNLLHEWANKLLVGIIVILAGIGKMGCPSCRKLTCSAKAKKQKAAPSKDKIKSMQVFTIGASNKLWIREKNMYKRISNYGHPDYFTRIREQKSVARSQAQPAGEIDAEGNYQP